MTLSVKVFDSPNKNYTIVDGVGAIGVTFGTNEHGFASFECFYPCSLSESFRIYDRPGLPHVEITAFGGTVWEGRLEDVAIVNGGVRLKAFGYQRALSDTLYTWGYATTAASAIVTALITSVSGINPSQLSSSAALVNSSGAVITDNYENARPADILNRLAGIGDTSGNLFEWGVSEGRSLYFRQRGSAGRDWFVDASVIELERSLDKLYNSGYGIYTGDSNQKLNTATSTDTDSVTRYGVTRQAAIGTDFYDATLAGVARDTFIASNSVATPRAKIRFSNIFDASGGKYPLWNVRSGDTITVRNLPPTVSIDVDYIRTFYVVATRYDADNDTLETELNKDLPSLDVQVSGSTNGPGAVLAQPSNHIVEGGLNVGSATGAATGEVRASSGLRLNSLTTGRLEMRTITVANNATAQLLNATGSGAGTFGIVFVLDLNDGAVAIFSVLGGGTNTQEMSDPAALFSITSGSAGNTNIYWSGGGSRYEIENRRGAERTYIIFEMVDA